MTTLQHIQSQLGNTIPKRIVSIVPSQTELLYHLGLDEEVVGITKFCIHPTHWFRNKQRIGGTKNIHISQIQALKPDLVIANKEENVKEQVEALQTFVPVYTSDIHNLSTALQMINDIGQLTNTSVKATTISQAIQQNFTTIPKQQKTKVCYLIWKEPYMSVGSDTFIHDMLQHCGFQNICEHVSRYPTLTETDIQRYNPSLVMLSSEPYPFKDKHIAELQTLLPHAKIILVDGEMFSWYGSRLQYAADYIKQLVVSIS